ncbi:MAG: LamG-like jellyroll fold domain-containing protein [Bryobacteraceae bacterium]|jgi:hypothetical protein
MAFTPTGILGDLGANLGELVLGTYEAIENVFIASGVGTAAFQFVEPPAAFTPTGILGDLNANLGEFILGTFQVPVVPPISGSSFAAAGSAAVSLAGAHVWSGKVAAAGAAATSALGARVQFGQFAAAGSSAITELDGSGQRSGVFSAAGKSSLSLVSGQYGYRLIPRRLGRWEKPPVGTQIEGGAPLAKDLRIAALINEGGGRNLWNAVGLVAAFLQGGYSPARGADGFGPWAYYPSSDNAWSFGAGAVLACPGSVSAAVVCDVPGDLEFGPLLFARGTITSCYYGSPVASGDWGIYGARGPAPNYTPYLGVWIDTAAGQQYLTFSVPPSPALIGFTYDGATLIAYVNGQRVASSTINWPLVTGSYALLLGGEASGVNQCWNVRLYAAYLWGRALSPSEMQQLWERPYTSLTVPLRRWVAIAPPSGAQWLGNFRAAAKATATWTAGASVGSEVFRALGVGTAEWNAARETTGEFSAHGRATAAWDAAPYLSGSFECDGQAAAEFVGSLDAQPYTCLTAGDGLAEGSVENFVY